MVKNDRLETLLESIEKRLEELKKMKIVSGDGISVTETDGNVLISCDRSSEYDTAVLRWLAALEEKTEEKRFSAGQGLVLEESPNGIRYSLEDGAKSCVEETHGEDASSDVPDFPFRVKGQLDERNLPYVVVCGHNEAEGRYFRSYVFAGTAAPEEIDEEVIYLQSSSWIYYTLSYSLQNNAWTATHKIRYAATLPSDQKYIVPIAYVVKNGTKYTVHQAHWGNIFIAGRVI